MLLQDVGRYFCAQLSTALLSHEALHVVNALRTAHSRTVSSRTQRSATKRTAKIKDAPGRIARWTKCGYFRPRCGMWNSSR